MGATYMVTLPMNQSSFRDGALGEKFASRRPAQQPGFDAVEIVDKETIRCSFLVNMTDNTTVPGLEAHLGFWMKYVSNHVSQAFARKVEGRGVTVAEWVVMRKLLDEEALAPSRLAEQLGLTRGAITKLADRLIDKALLVRHPNPDDARAQTLSLTARARRLVPELAALADKNEAEFFDHMAARDRQTLERLLKEIVARRGLKTLPVD
jgi:DNA-binding MarR family transcriptional regulator